MSRADPYGLCGAVAMRQTLSPVRTTQSSKEEMTWQDAQHQYVDIVQRPQPRPVLHAVTKVVAIVVTARPTLRMAVVGAATAVVVLGPATA